MPDTQEIPREKAPLEYPFPDSPPAGSVSEVAPGIFWARMPLPFALDHVNLWLIADGADWVVVDCGYATEESRSAWEHILDRGLAGRPVTRLIVTHCHPDHIGLCAWLGGQFGLVPHLTKAEFLLAHAAYHGIGGTERARLMGLSERHGLAGERLAAMGFDEEHYRRGVAALPNAFHRIKHGDELLIGDRRWRVIVGYGHAPEHAALYCEELSVLISGDMLLPRITTNVSVWPMEPEGDPLNEFLSSLDGFSALRPETLVLPSHGLPFRGMHGRIAELHRHHQQRLETVTEVCEGPTTAAQLLPLLFERRLDNFQLFFAMGETIAHLNYLLRRGVLDRAEGSDGIYRFVRRPVAAPRGEMT